jgi:hypothetical protein
VTESQGTLAPRKTAAVTVAGALLLLPAVACALVAIYFATGGGGHLGGAIASGFYLAAAAILGYAGLAIIRRWSGWRIWAGLIAWGLIALVLLNLFKTPPPPGTDRSSDTVADLVVFAFAVFVLVAKRRERRLDLGAVFDD